MEMADKSKYRYWHHSQGVLARLRNASVCTRSENPAVITEPAINRYQPHQRSCLKTSRLKLAAGRLVQAARSAMRLTRKLILNDFQRLSAVTYRRQYSAQMGPQGLRSARLCCVNAAPYTVAARTRAAPCDSLMGDEHR